MAVESLADEFDLMDIATAAEKLAHEAGGSGDEKEIPPVTSPAAEPRKRPRPPARDVTRLYIGLGRRAGVRPQDLVGAIANEARIHARGIGAIDITDRFSVVEVPDEAAEDVIHALSGTTIRGKRVTVRRDRQES